MQITRPATECVLAGRWSTVSKHCCACTRMSSLQSLQSEACARLPQSRRLPLVRRARRAAVAPIRAALLCAAHSPWLSCALRSKGIRITRAHSATHARHLDALPLQDSWRVHHKSWMIGSKSSCIDMLSRSTCRRSRTCLGKHSQRGVYAHTCTWLASLRDMGACRFALQGGLRSLRATPAVSAFLPLHVLGTAVANIVVPEFSEARRTLHRTSASQRLEWPYVSELAG